MNRQLAFFLAAASGFIAIGFEIVWFRIMSFVHPGAEAFGLLLGVYLLGIAAGSERVRRHKEHLSLETVGRLFLISVIISSLVVPLCYIAGISALLVSIPIAAMVMGALFPILADALAKNRTHFGDSVGQLYFVNILGSTTGSLFTGFVLIDQVGSAGACFFLCTLGMLCGVFLLRKSFSEKKTRYLGVAALATLALFPLTYKDLYSKLLGIPCEQVEESRFGVIQRTVHGEIYGGGVYDGQNRVHYDHDDDRNMSIRAYAIPALHPKPTKMLMVGLGGGSWAKIASFFPEVKEITVIEINPDYEKLVRSSPVTRSILDDPRINIVVDDGRRWMRRNSKKFDFILMNTTFHFRSNASSLLSKDFLNLAQSRLNPEGVLYYNTTSSGDVFATANAACKHTLRVVNFVACSDRPLKIDGKAWAARLRQIRHNGQPLVSEDAARALERFANPTESNHLYAIQDEASLRESYVEHIITDDNMYPEWHFAKPCLE